jgi:uncharacterized protein YjbJ (UPF0337 family)
MTEHNKADEARKGLIDSVKGKAKEIVGAVTGNDSMTAEGQLEQTQANERKEANSVEAVADAEAAEAHTELNEARVEGAQERAAVNANAAVVESNIADQQDAQKRVAEQNAQRDAVQKKTQAELDALAEVQHAKAQERDEIDSAADEVVEAVDDHLTAVQGAASAEAEADRIRAQAHNLTNQADLP